MSATVTSFHYLPQARNEVFCGRKHVLDSLHQSLSAGGRKRVQCIYGNSGMGKTQLAIEYAYLHSNEYNIIAWFPAADEGTLASYFLWFAEQIGAIAPGQTDILDARRAVAGVLAESNAWLLIFDNAAGIDVIQPYIPETGGHVLVTSRHDKWDAIGEAFCLRVMERADSVEFLTRRSGRPFDPAAHTLCKALDDVPLAIEQAGAVIASAGLKYADYLTRFENHWAELLRSGRPAGEYPDCVAMTWELACRELEDVDSDLSGLLNVLGYLAETQISRSMMMRAAAVLPYSLSDRLAYRASLDEAINRLQQFSLLSASDDYFQVHRLVAALTRDRMPDGQRGQWCDMALKMMARAFTFDEDAPSTWNDCAEALPHALAASEHARKAAIDPATNAKLLNSVGEYLNQIGQYQQAQDTLEEALSLSDEAHGSANVRRSAIINNLGRVLTRLGSYDAAREHFESALKLDQTHYGDSHPHVAEVANNFGTLLHHTGDYRSALKQFEWALEICRNNYGPDHSKVASITNNIAYALANLGDVNRAIEYFRAAIAAAEAAVGPNHAIIATMRSNLGIALRHKGETDAARAELERAVIIGQQTLGPNHLDVARSLTNLGKLYLEQSDFAPARKNLEQALRIFERTLGPNHLQLCDRLQELARCSKAMGDAAAAHQYLERSGRISRGN